MVRFENVGLRYGLGAEILRDISFEIRPQSFQFLTGPSGAGKTTLLRLILLSLKPTRGYISLFGQDASQLEKDTITQMRRRIGVVFQDFRLLDHLTAIARALIVRPELLLADEPTGNVDPTLARRLLRLFTELNKSGTAVVIATHDIALMDQFDGASRLVLGEGRLHVYD